MGVRFDADGPNSSVFAQQGCVSAGAPSGYTLPMARLSTSREIFAPLTTSAT
jgi:hypothetical protein